MRAPGRELLALAALGLAAGSCSSGCARVPAEPDTLEPGASDRAVAADRRVAPLLVDCPLSGFYDRDLSDLVPVLLTKVEQAQPDPLKRAKEELGLLGAEAFPALGHAFHGYYTDPQRSPFLENVVDALTFNAADESHALLMEALRHPQESVRSKALDGLQRLARPEDFDVLVERLAIETRELRRHTVPALFRADRTRAEAFVLDAIARGDERDLWLGSAPFLAESESLATAQRCAELYPGLDMLLAAQLAAAAARHGLPGAREHLRAELADERTQRRLNAVEALRRARLFDELRPALLEDRAAEVRALAAAALRGIELTDERRAWLQGALTDSDPSVRGEALGVLCAAGDPEGLTLALAELDGASVGLQLALQALRVPLQNDAEVARVAYERLLARHAREEHRPLAQRTATFKAIGQMPLAAAAELLHALGRAAGETRLESLRAHEWLMIQAANTGVAGRGALVRALAAEDDPLRRIDLIDSIGSIRDDLARNALLELVEQDARSPLERLFAASVLIRVGPSWEVAPRLKRVAFAMQGPSQSEARAGLQCLLWQWY